MAKTLKKAITRFRVMVRSRHPSHEILREALSLLPFRSVVRLGSIWAGDGKQRVELNSIEAIKNSSDKLRMKECFNNSNVISADWQIFDHGFMGLEGTNYVSQDKLDFPVVAKHRRGSRGTGNYLLNTQQEFEAWSIGKTMSNYIFEKFHDYVREYRLHVTADGCFYTCRKLLREDTPQENRWYRNDSNSNWIVESNESFDKPVNWSTIESECVKALNAVGLDMGACDVKVQSSKTSSGKVRKDPKFIVIEINSAASFGEITAEKYLQVIPQLLLKKHNARV